MTTQEKAKILLQKLFETIKDTGDVYLETDQVSLEEIFPVNELPSIFKYLKDCKYIKPTQCVGSAYPDAMEITASGIDWLEDKESEKPISKQIFNISGNNYGPVGTNSNFTINNSFDFEEFEKLINKNTSVNSVDRSELEEVKQHLIEISNNNQAISNGCFSKFSGVMQKHSWISGQLAGFLLRWALGK